MSLRIRKLHILIDKIYIRDNSPIDIMRCISRSLDRHMERVNPLNHLMDEIRLRQWLTA